MNFQEDDAQGRDGCFDIIACFSALSYIGNRKRNKLKLPCKQIPPWFLCIVNEYHIKTFHLQCAFSLTMNLGYCILS